MNVPDVGCLFLKSHSVSSGSFSYNPEILSNYPKCQYHLGSHSKPLIHLEGIVVFQSRFSIKAVTDM